MSASDVIKQAFAGYRAYGGYLVFLTTAFYLVLGVAGLSSARSSARPGCSYCWRWAVRGRWHS